MTAPTKDQIYNAALASLSAYPTVAQYVQAGDPRILAQLGAQAAMLAMVAEHVDVAQFEPFLKARDSTVLADASLKGILPLARPCRVVLTVTNGNAASFSLPAGRRVMDAKGRVYEVEAAAVIPASGTASVGCIQRTQRTATHTVAAATPFYMVQVPEGAVDAQLAAIQVSKDSGATVFSYSPDWCNVAAGDLVYQVETDERRRLWVMFGATGKVGYGVQVGDVFEMLVSECEGRIDDLTPGAAFSFEYVLTVPDGGIELALASVADAGADPLNIEDLRTMSRYPAIFDHNAVYLGEFDFLLRRYISPVDFLSVWNEEIEESVRGASVDNINTLFVAGSVPAMTTPAFQARVTELIARADDSYRVEFVPVALTPVPVAVTASVSVVHDAGTVAAQIRTAILDSYGVGAAEVSRGMSSPIRFQALAKLLRESVPALQDQQSDFTVTTTPPVTLLPEMFIHVSDASLTVTVERATFNNGLWNF